MFYYGLVLRLHLYPSLSGSFHFPVSAEPCNKEASPFDCSKSELHSFYRTLGYYIKITI